MLYASVEYCSAATRSACDTWYVCLSVRLCFIVVSLLSMLRVHPLAHLGALVGWTLTARDSSRAPRRRSSLQSLRCAVCRRRTMRQCGYLSEPGAQPSGCTLHGL